MLRKIVILLSLGFCIAFSTANIFGQKIVTAAQVNGTWREVSSKSAGITTEFKIWSLGAQKLQVEFSANNAAAKFSNSATGTVLIEGTTATFQPEENQINTESPCVITLKFAADKLIVAEKGECGWGRGIGSAGTYKKISSKNRRLTGSKTKRDFQKTLRNDM